MSKTTLKVELLGSLHFSPLFDAPSKIGASTCNEWATVVYNMDVLSNKGSEDIKVVKLNHIRYYYSPLDGETQLPKDENFICKVDLVEANENEIPYQDKVFYQEVCKKYNLAIPVVFL